MYNNETQHNTTQHNTTQRTVTQHTVTQHLPGGGREATVSGVNFWGVNDGWANGSPVDIILLLLGRGFAWENLWCFANKWWPTMLSNQSSTVYNKLFCCCWCCCCWEREELCWFVASSVKKRFCALFGMAKRQVRCCCGMTTGRSHSVRSVTSRTALAGGGGGHS